jgi:hypothetical protein
MIFKKNTQKKSRKEERQASPSADPVSIANPVLAADIAQGACRRAFHLAISTVQYNTAQGRCESVVSPHLLWTRPNSPDMGERLIARAHTFLFRSKRRNFQGGPAHRSRCVSYSMMEIRGVCNVCNALIDMSSEPRLTLRRWKTD